MESVDKTSAYVETNTHVEYYNEKDLVEENEEMDSALENLYNGSLNKISSRLLPPKRRISEPEIQARAIIAGDKTAAKNLLDAIRANDRKHVLPVLFVLRALFHQQTKSNIAVGDVVTRGAEIQLEKSEPDASLVGGLLALVTLYNAPALAGIVHRLCNEFRLSGTVIESLLALRFVAFGDRNR